MTVISDARNCTISKENSQKLLLLNNTLTITYSKQLGIP